jgi:hypothetical protein
MPDKGIEILKIQNFKLKFEFKMTKIKFLKGSSKIVLEMKPKLLIDVMNEIDQNLTQLFCSVLFITVAFY